MSRQIVGLQKAEPCERPKTIPVGRPRGAKAAGLRYERSLAKAMPAAKHGQWFQFQDRAGDGCCQTDLLLGSDGACFVIEAKYTWTLEGHEQLERLYLPVVGMALARPCFGIVVARRLLSQMPGIVVANSLGQALIFARQGRRVCWHWIGAERSVHLSEAAD